MTRLLSGMSGLGLLALSTAGCAPPDDADVDATIGGQVDVYFNDPGVRPDNLWKNPDGLRAMVNLIHNAEATIDFSVMGFSHPDIVDAIEMAWERGIRVRMVGDADHWYNEGYQRMLNRQVPMSIGNQQHIMHNKFLIVDDRFVFIGTANWTKSDMTQNSNNMILVDHPGVAADFKAEFEQMFDGLFGYMKREIDNGRVYQVGDTEVEVWFSPNEDTLGRMLEVVDGAEESVNFTIFAFTQDFLGSSYIRKHQEVGRRFDLSEKVAGEIPRYGISGVIDQSQLHSNGQYHESYRLLSAGIPLRMDGNDQNRKPGDYQAGGGRLHSKTMMIDTYAEDPDIEKTIVTGSFNWSASATLSNDEFLVLLRGDRVADLYNDYYRYLWDSGRHIGETWVVEPGDEAERERAERLGKEVIEPGDIVINEVLWYGLTEPSDPDAPVQGNEEGFAQFIELRNLTDRPLRLDMWSVSGVDDFVVGIPPGSIIPPDGVFTIVDHVTEVYRDGEPQDNPVAITTGDLILNSFNDNRQARLYLKGSAIELFLKDSNGRVVDVAGDGGAAFAGGPVSGRAHSMERREADPGDGSDPANWYTCTAAEGSDAIHPAFRDQVIATPGEPNSSPPPQ